MSSPATPRAGAMVVNLMLEASKEGIGRLAPSSLNSSD